MFCATAGNHVGRIMLVNAGLLLGYMTLVWLIAYRRRRFDTVDAAWGLGFVVVALSTLAQQTNSRTGLIAVLVTIWGLRLATHILRRSLKKGEDDPRYVEMTGKWQGNVWLKAYLKIFLLQGVLIWIVSLAIMLASGPERILNTLSIIGAVLWVVGFSCEALADRQLRQYLKDKDRPKVLQTGLWRFSRHPNYFGELTQWWAIGIIACGVSWGWLGLIGPLVLSVLIIFISGIPPIEKRRAKDAAYREYQEHTSPLIPLPPRK